MKRTLPLLISLALLITTACITTQVASSDEWTLVFNDEFSTSTVDESKWHIITTKDFAPRSGQTEFQKDNVSIMKNRDGKNDGNGYLVIKNEIGGCEAGSSAKYTSGRVYTNDNFQFGKYEIRAKCAEATGTNSAFWSLGYHPDYWGGYETLKGNEQSKYLWMTGEIDIIERFNVPAWNQNKPWTVNSNLHFSTNRDKTTYNRDADKTTYDSIHPGNYQYTANMSGPDLGSSWHTFALEWDINSMKFFCDGNQYAQFDISSKNESDLWAFREFGQRFILSDWMGNYGTVSGNSTFEIDYFRVYQKSGCYMNYQPFSSGNSTTTKAAATTTTKAATTTTKAATTTGNQSAKTVIDWNSRGTRAFYTPLSKSVSAAGVTLNGSIGKQVMLNCWSNNYSGCETLNFSITADNANTLSQIYFKVGNTYSPNYSIKQGVNNFSLKLSDFGSPSSGDFNVISINANSTAKITISNICSGTSSPTQSSTTTTTKTTTTTTATTSTKATTIPTATTETTKPTTFTTQQRNQLYILPL